MIETLFLMALAVYWILRFVEHYLIDGVPEWAMQVVVLVSAGAALIPYDQSWVKWYSPFAIAGLVVILRLLENLWIVAADESLTNVLRNRRR